MRGPAVPIILAAGLAPRAIPDAIVIDVAGRQLRRGDAVVRLRMRAFRMLAVLLARAPAVVGYRDLIEAVWGERRDGGPLMTGQSIGNALYRDRRALEQLGVRVRTHCGVGRSAEVLS